MSALHWWPIGVKKAQDAPTATDIKNASELTPIDRAIPTDIGAIIRAVAALLIIVEQYLALLLYDKQINLIILLNMNIFILLFYYPIFLLLNRLNKYN